MIRISALTLSLLVGAGACARTDNNEGLKPDLTVSLHCSQPLGLGDKTRLETGLYSAGFDVLDETQLAREGRFEISKEVSIIAIDPKGRFLFIDSRSSEGENPPFGLDVSLYTRPPTARDAALERELETLAAEAPMCSVAQVERGTNPRSTEWLYNDAAKNIRNWFNEDRREAPESAAWRVHVKP